MSDDPNRYKPRISKVIRETAAEKVEERVRRALDDPGFQAAVAELERERAEDDGPRVSAPSPWRGGGAELDKSALPSALRPGEAAEPVEKPVEVRSPRDVGRRPPGWLIVLAVVGIVGPIVVLLIGRGKDASTPAAPTASASVAPAAPAASTVAAPVPSPGAEPGGATAATAAMSANAVPATAVGPRQPVLPAKKTTDAGASKPEPGEDIW